MKRPSFQFYPQDFLADPNVLAMNNEEVGVYIKLISLMWNTEDCSLKNDPEYLAKITHSNKDVITSLLHCFKVVKDTLRHKRLDEERKKQDSYKEACSEAGKKGMASRWGKDKVVITKDNSSSSSSSSSSKYNNNYGKEFEKLNYNQKGAVFTMIKEFTKNTGTAPKQENIDIMINKVLNAYI